MMTIKKLAYEIVAREGGFVNDPDDPGGATNYGVTIGTMKSLGVDVNHDGRVDISDVKGLTKEMAADIYVAHYFIKPNIDKLPGCLQAPVLDMQVNAGSNAVKILQRMLTSIGFKCSDDGAIGPGTIAAANQASQSRPKDLADLYGAARRDYYYALGDARPASRKYAKRKDGGKGGWITRAEEFMSPGSRLTEAQHRARVSKWA